MQQRPFGAWGFNDTPAGCPDEIPWVDTMSLLGLRFNCERSGTNRSNLQSFLVIDGGDAESQAMGGRIPNNPWLVGRTLAVQAVDVPANGAAVLTGFYVDEIAR